MFSVLKTQFPATCSDFEIEINSLTTVARITVILVARSLQISHPLKTRKIKSLVWDCINYSAQ